MDFRFQDVCARAAEGGHLGIVQWLSENGGTSSASTCAEAAKSGHLEILKWATVEKKDARGTKARAEGRPKVGTLRSSSGQGVVGVLGTNGLAQEPPWGGTSLCSCGLGQTGATG